MTENNANIPPAKGFDEFQTLSSTKQNIELFKILSAIAEEIEGLRQSTERRFHLIESLVQQNGKEIVIYSCFAMKYTVWAKKSKKSPGKKKKLVKSNKSISRI